MVRGRLDHPHRWDPVGMLARAAEARRGAPASVTSLLLQPSGRSGRLRCQRLVAARPGAGRLREAPEPPGGERAARRVPERTRSARWASTVRPGLTSGAPTAAAPAGWRINCETPGLDRRGA